MEVQKVSEQQGVAVTEHQTSQEVAESKMNRSGKAALLIYHTFQEGI